MQLILAADALSDGDMVNYAYTILGKVRENSIVSNNTAEQALLGDFSKAMQCFSSSQLASGFARVIFDLIKASSLSDLGSQSEKIAGRGQILTVS